MFRLMNGRRLVVGARGLGLASAAVMVVCAFGVTSAMAAPTGEYAVFAQCPVHAAGVNGCIVSHAEGGEIKIGSGLVLAPPALQGGLVREEEPLVKHLAAALNGETLIRTPQQVPGGLGSLVRCRDIASFFGRVACRAIFDHGVTGVDAVIELAAPASSVILNAAFEALGEGSALTLPVKVRLENPLLGDECYIGSEADPIALELTTGATSPPPPNTSITGKPGKQMTKAEGGILVLGNALLVDNSFAVPAATGCGGVFSSLIDPVINAKLGLPSAPGQNTAILQRTDELASSEIVEESETSEATTTLPPPPPPRHHRRWGAQHDGAHRDRWTREKD